MPIDARRGASFGPTSRSSATDRSPRSRRVRPSAARAVTALLDADEIRVERLTALVDLHLHVRMLQREMLLEVTGVGLPGVGPDEDGHDLVVAVDDRVAQRRRGLTRGRGDRPDPFA